MAKYIYMINQRERFSNINTLSYRVNTLNRYLSVINYYIHV